MQRDGQGERGGVREIVIYNVKFEDRGLGSELERAKQLIDELRSLVFKLENAYGLVVEPVDSEEEQTTDC